MVRYLLVNAAIGLDDLFRAYRLDERGAERLTGSARNVFDLAQACASSGPDITYPDQVITLDKRRDASDSKLGRAVKELPVQDDMLHMFYQHYRRLQFKHPRFG